MSTASAQSTSVVDLVSKAVTSLEILSSVLRQSASNENKVRDTVSAVEEDAKKLHSVIDSMAGQRVIVLSADQLMEAGVILYNASRATYKCFLACGKDVNKQALGDVRFPALFMRFLAARAMGLALSCSKNDQDEAVGATRDQCVFIDDCLDVLRSYGRVGSLLLETATVDSGKCFEYLTLAKDAFDNANGIWTRVGLSCLTRFKEGIDLEEILQDLWDFCVDRVRVIQILQEYAQANGDSAVSEINETLHELQMLLPYMSCNSKSLLELIQELLIDWKRRERHADLVALAEEALRLCDAMENAQDMMDDTVIPSFKRLFLVSLLDSVGSLGDVEKAEACFALLGSDKDSAVLLTMVKLYLQQLMNEKAAMALKHLFQRDDVASSIAGARLFVKANGFSDDSLQMYRQLERHYGDHTLQIGSDLACSLAVSENPQHRAMAIEDIKRIGESLMDMPSDQRARVDDVVSRMRQTIQDAAQVALNERLSEECTMWAELGIQLAQTPEESAFFKRVIASAYFKLDRRADSWKWANEAYHTDMSKPSLFGVFEASLGMDDPDSASAINTIRQLRQRDDFDAQDLVVYGHAAHTSGREDICLLIMDELCSLLCDPQAKIPELPVGLLLQNTAQLALRTATETTADSDASTTSYAGSFVKYTDMFLQAADKVTKVEVDQFAPQSVFLWFYAMSFNIARSCNYASLFVRAADIASHAKKLFGDECAVSTRELDCLLAALSTEMAVFESGDAVRLDGLLEMIARIKLLAADSDDHSDFVGKCELAVRLRLYDPDIDAMRKLCHDKMLRNSDNYIDIGELVLQAARSDEANAVRMKYRGLACNLFKHSLQLLLQGDTTDQEKLSYLFRRLISLAESRKDAYQWLEQLVQLAASIDIKFPDVESEWFVSRAWNMGVQQHRSQSFEEAQRFMKMALALLGNVGSSLTELGKDLHQQYQHLTDLSGSDAIANN